VVRGMLEPTYQIQQDSCAHLSKEACADATFDSQATDSDWGRCWPPISGAEIGRWRALGEQDALQPLQPDCMILEQSWRRSGGLPFWLSKVQWLRPGPLKWPVDHLPIRALRKICRVAIRGIFTCTLGFLALRAWQQSVTLELALTTFWEMISICVDQMLLLRHVDDLQIPVHDLTGRGRLTLREPKPPGPRPRRLLSTSWIVADGDPRSSMERQQELITPRGLRMAAEEQTS